MPTYEYRCENGHDFEAFQKMSDDPLDTCPECGAPAKRRISSGAGLVFKGSGFYITDYKRAGEKKGSGEGGDTKSSGEKGSSGKSSDSGESSGSGGSGADKSGSSGSGGTKSPD
jgi:putative FmdB family regulatory protein